MLTLMFLCVSLVFAVPPGNSKFTDAISGLSFKIPAGWQYVENQYPPLFLSEPDKEIQDFIMLDKYFRDIPVEEAFDKYWENMEKHFEGLKLVEKKELLQKERKLIKVFFTYKKEKEEEENKIRKRKKKEDSETKKRYMVFVKTGSIINIIGLYNYVKPQAEIEKYLSALISSISFDTPPKVLHSLFSAKDSEIYSLIDKKKLREANEIADNALLINRQDAQILMLKAVIYANMKQEEEALVFIEEAFNQGYYDMSSVVAEKAFADMMSKGKLNGIIKRKKELVKKGREALLARAKRELASYFEIKIPETNVILFTDIKDNGAIKVLKESMVTSATFAKETLKIVPSEFPMLWIMSANREVNKGLIGTLMGTSSGFEGVYLNSFGIFVSDRLTGYGTFVHEYMHALHSGDQNLYLQKHPRWLTEMLATTFESLKWNVVKEKLEVDYKSGRLDTICERIRTGKHVGFDKLISGNDGWTEGIDIEVFYAAVRYLGLYLYKKELLGEFYKEYKKTYEKDRTGKTALETVTGKKLDLLEKEWEGWTVQIFTDNP